jgi:formylmethanofuran dehydrogenase subunit B
MADSSPNDAIAGGKPLPQPDVNQFSDLPCPFCACLCDDLRLSVAAGRVIEVDGACSLARAQILAAGTARPEARIAGEDASRAEAIREAARLLATARAPLIFGFGRATCEAQAAAVEIASFLGSVIDSPGGDEALQTVGEVSCTLGEMRQRADLVVVWGADPLKTHPRLLERHAPPGIDLTVVDSSETTTAAAAQRWLRIEPGRSFEAATALRALLRNKPLDESQVVDRTGVALATWRELLDRMKEAKYGVVISAPGSDKSTAESLSLSRLVRELNDHTRWVRLALPGSVNATGAASVLAWRTGFSHGVDFSVDNSTANLNGLICAERLLQRGEVDVALVICDDPAEHFGAAALKRLAAIPTVVIDWQQTADWRAANVALTVAVPGIEAAGTMFRFDGVPLGLRPVIGSPVPSDFELMRMLIAAIRMNKVGFSPGKPGG